MSDQPEPPIDPVSDLPNLPYSETTKKTLTYAFPNILLGIGVDANGFVARQIREGESRQVEHTTVTTYSKESVEEKPFTITAQNTVRFGQSPLRVINDAVDLGELVLPPTSPTASEYLKMIGQDVMVGFLCRRLSKLAAGHELFPVFRIDRTTIKLL